MQDSGAANFQDSHCPLPTELLTGSEPTLYLDFCLVVFLVGWEKAAFSMRMQW